jgi:hypothetical protein
MVNETKTKHETKLPGFKEIGLDISYEVHVLFYAKPF